MTYEQQEIMAAKDSVRRAQYFLDSAIECGATGIGLKQHQSELRKANAKLKKLVAAQ